MLRDAIRKSIDDEEPAYGYDEVRMAAWLRFVLDDVTGFYPQDRCLQLVLDDVYNHIVNYFPDDDELWKFVSASQTISYENIGFENLNIFR